MKSFAWILLVVGAINWGLVGAFGFNLVSRVFGTWPALLTVVYILIGLAGIWALVGRQRAM